MFHSYSYRSSSFPCYFQPRSQGSKSFANLNSLFIDPRLRFNFFIFDSMFSLTYGALLAVYYYYYHYYYYLINWFKFSQQLGVQCSPGPHMPFFHQKSTSETWKALHCQSGFIFQNQHNTDETIYKSQHHISKISCQQTCALRNFIVCNLFRESWENG